MRCHFCSYVVIVSLRYEVIVFIRVFLRALPIMFAVTLDLRIFANNVSRTLSSVCHLKTVACLFICACLSWCQAEQQLQVKGKGKVGDMLEKAAEQLMSCFRVCASDK